MKSNTKKRLIAFMLCMVLVLSSATSAFADEPQNTDSQSQAEVVTEPVADEATGNEATGDEATEDEAAVNSSEQQQQEEQQPETESTPEGNLEDDISIQTTINGTTITMSGPYSSFPEGSNYEILASELNEEETKNVEVALKKKEDEINTKIATYKAYDIKLLVDGIESQPTGNVNVKFEGGEVQENLETAENIEVYHVDETTQIANDIEKTAVDDTVTMTTNHFSTYVITTFQPNGVDITVQHYIRYTDSNHQPAEKALYRASKIHLNKDQEIKDLSSLQNYTSLEVFKINPDGSKGDSISNKQVITADQTYRVYYTPTTATSNEAVQMFDYQVKGEKNTSINAEKNYDSRSTKTTRFASGLANNQYSDNGYDTTIKIGNEKFHINTWDTNSKGNKVNQYNNTFHNAMTGIVKGVDFNTGALKMGLNSDEEQLYEPGFFTTNEKSGKHVLDGYKLNFSRTGDTYTLTGVNKPDGSSALSGSGYNSNDGSNFFPLDSIRDLYKDDANNPQEHNCFFGMRYDIEFTIGDYLGDLNYSFTGDDDLWVILDAQKDGGQVVIDLGGIHSALSKEVDLWKILLKKGNDENYTEKEKQEYKDKNTKHTLTILYMERGAYKSNCKMNFTLPNSRIVTPSTIPTADLNLKKVNTSNKGIANTTFKLVNDAAESDVKTATSDSAGDITFTELREGNYTLSEEFVPESYVRETSTWKVKVTKSEGTALTAVLYDTTGETAKEKNADGTYHIVNLTQGEHTQQLMEYNKTAHVTDWDNRTYDIDITASSKMTSQTTHETGGEANVMLVLDSSGSMDETSSQTNYILFGANTAAIRNNMHWSNTYYLKTNDGYVKISYKLRKGDWYVNDKKLSAYSSSYEIYTKTTVKTTRMDALKAAANQFIDNTAEKSPNSKIGISVFSSENYGCNGTSKELLQAGTNKDTLKSFINDLYAKGGTKPAIGLDDAYTKLKAAKDNGDTLPQYVILFTDGAPTGNNLDNSWDNEAKKASEATAKKLKEMGVTVYTIGFALDSSAQTYLAGDSNNPTNYPGIASPGCAKTADTADSLLDIFNKISETITNSLEIHNATIVDAIDPRFVILDDDGKQITPDYLKDKPNNQVTLENGGTVYYENGIQYIQWTKQTLPKHSENKQWKQTIHVQAQTDYIGGNNVPTNISPDSKITTTEFGDTPLPQPKVNVKAELTLNDKKITIYKGDDVPPADTVLADMVQNYTKNTTSYGISENSFTVQWYSSEQLEENKKIATAVIDTKVENDTTYCLTVTYNAGAPSDESNTNTTITKDDGSSEAKYAGNETTYQVVAAVDQNREYGIYTIHVISGRINITKKLTDPAKEDQTFNFEVKCGDTVITVPITVKKGKETATITNENDLNKLTALPRGTYTVTEKEDSNTGYILNGSAVNENTNCENSSKNNSVTFVLGNSKDKKENVIKDYTYDPSLGGTLGYVTFTNEKVIKNWDIVKVSTSSKDVKLQGAEFTLTDSNNTTYTGTSGSDGKITWKDANSKLVTVLPGGTYTFKETKAPVGYAVNPETWTIKISSTKGYLKSITKADGTEITGTETNSIVHYYFEDEAVYALPSAGGTGIYLYMIGGILLMFAAAWILYKNKCKEVLEK